MMLTRAALVLAVAANCAPREVVAERLSAEPFKETVVAGGLGPNGGVMEVWASPETGTWTITGSSPDGSMTCILASGISWTTAIPLIPAGTAL